MPRSGDAPRKFCPPEGELHFEYARSSGPGGQNVNKVNSKAILRWNARRNTTLPDEVRQRFLERYAGKLTTTGEVVISSQRYRDQPRNADDCLAKLATMIEAVWRPPKRRRATRPTLASRERRHEAKQRQSQKKSQRRDVSGD